jgi:RHS repeat-associated protein
VLGGFGVDKRRINAALHIYDGEDILEERPGAGATVRNVHGPGIDQPLARVESGVSAFFLADHLGSVLQMTNASATVTLTRKYDPWGNPIQGSATSGYAYTGREWDTETGLAYYRARYYDPKIGRFLSEDPLGYWDGPNLYLYVRNNPINRTDPFGLAAIDAPPLAFPPGCVASVLVGNYLSLQKVGHIPGADRFFHCMAICEATKHCAGGGPLASAAGEVREVIQELVAVATTSGAARDDAMSDSQGDRDANNTGRSCSPKVPCSQTCAPHRPPGMPDR